MTLILPPSSRRTLLVGAGALAGTTLLGGRGMAQTAPVWAVFGDLMAGLLGAFDPHVYSADLVERAKPHPDIFLHAAERLEVDPARCLAIEDSVNGVRAALAAGMTVWGFAAGGHVDAQGAARLAEAGAHQVMESWAEAAERFAAF